MSEKKSRKKIVSTVCNVTLWALLAILVFFVAKLVVCQINGKASFFFNKAVLQVATPSMVNNKNPEKGINVGEFILVSKIDAKDIKKDDIISFYSQDPTIKGKINTHRVLDIEVADGKYTFTTKGDNNIKADDYKVDGQDVVGVMTAKLTFLTGLMDFFAKNVLVIVIIFVPLGIGAFVFIKFYSKKNGVDGKSKEDVMNELVKKEVEKLKAENLDINELKDSLQTQRDNSNEIVDNDNAGGSIEESSTTNDEE